MAAGDSMDIQPVHGRDWLAIFLPRRGTKVHKKTTTNEESGATNAPAALPLQACLFAAIALSPLFGFLFPHTMRSEADKTKILNFITALGNRVRGAGRVYLTGGATALLFGWREMTVDIDLKSEPEPSGFFEAIAELKEELDVNLELASPDQFIPELPGWRERSEFITRAGMLDFYHYDFFAQALSKLERGHERDLADIAAMVDLGIITKGRLLELFHVVAPDLIRYPAIDIPSFTRAVKKFCDES